MMKKILSLILIAVFAISFSGCGDETAKKAVEQSKLSMAGGDYTAALNYLKLAQSEGDKDPKNAELVKILETYIKAKDEFEKGSFPDSSKTLESLTDSYKNYGVAPAIDSLRNELAKKLAVSNNVDEQLSAVRNWIATGDYASASLNITEVYTKDMNAEQRKQADVLRATLETAQSKIAAAETNVTVAAPSYDYSGDANVVATYFVANCRESITLRAAPSTAAAEITQIPLGQAVGYIENAGNGFYKINYDGLVGYALANYLSSSRYSGNAGKYAQVVNCREWITLRSYPSTEAASLDRIPLGAYVTYISTADNGFYYIEYNGQRGYSLQQYLAVR